MTTFEPTDEQVEALRLFSTGRNLAIQAGAGTGKSRTLQLLAESCPDRVGIYTAFNKAIVTDAGAKMPATTTCATMHSLAMRSIDRRYRAKLDRARRMRPADAAKALGIEGLPVGYGTERKFLAKGFLASLALKAIDRFCQSGDPAPAAHHVPYIEGIDVPRPDGTRGYSNNDLVRAHLVPAMARAWADILTFDGGRLTSFSLGHCLKIFERTHPVLMADYLMVDEAQDLNGVMISVIEQQRDMQLVVVGDSAQSINEWMGSIDALAKVPADNTTYLTASFRFGPAVADVANGLLSRLGAQLRLAGRAPHMSVVAAVAEADCILTRTNAEAVKTVLRILGEGRRPFLMGGGADVVRFAEAAQALQNGEWTGHPDLSCFTDWSQVQSYCVAPETKVLTQSLDWVPIGQLAEGDELVGFDEEAGPGPSGRTYQPAVVTSTRRVQLPCWRVTFDDGTVITASRDHRWIVNNGTGTSNHWKTTARLRIGEHLPSIGTWEREETHDGGWLAGMYDGEGHINRSTRGHQRKAYGIGISQKPGPVLERVERLLKERGFEYSRRDYSSASRLHLLGGFNERLRLLGTLQPTRLQNTALPALWGCRMETRRLATVVGIEDVGEQEVVALGTSTGTFIGEGLHHHNCADDPQGSDLRLLVDLIDEYGPEKIIATLNNPTPAADADVTVSTAHKSKGCEWDSVQLAGDFFAPRDGADDVAPSELKLLYVACTRARRELDVTLVPHAVKAPTAAPPLALDSVVAEPPAPVVPDIDPEALSGPSTPLSCPTCGRVDVVRGGLIGAHRCVAVAR